MLVIDNSLKPDREEVSLIQKIFKLSVGVVFGALLMLGFNWAVKVLWNIAVPLCPITIWQAMAGQALIHLTLCPLYTRRKWLYGTD